MFSVPVTCPRSAVGETAVYRNPNSAQQLRARIKTLPDISNFQQLHQRSSVEFADLDCLGTRVKNPDGTLGEYKFKSYKTCHDIARKAGTAILKHNLASLTEVKGFPECKIIAIFSKNCEEWVLLDMACCLYGFATIPIFETLGLDSLEFICDQTGLETIFASEVNIERLLKDAALGKLSKLKTIVCLSPYDKKYNEAAKAAKINLMNWQEFLKLGGDTPLPYPKVTGETIYSLAYTSGTTGNPKAAISTQANMLSAVASSLETPGIDLIVKGDVHISYLPVAHIFERVFVEVMLAQGVKIGFFNGDVQKLRDDLQALRPTHMISVPRLYNIFYEGLQAALVKIAQAMAAKAGAPPVRTLTHEQQIALIKKLPENILNQLRQITGGRVKIYYTGSAPIALQTMEFWRTLFGVPFVEGFGQTETMSACTLQHPDDRSLCNIGGAMTNTEFKLVDIPEMNYTSKDKGPDGQPLPRGELCLRGPNIFHGYFKEPQITAETIDKDGWHHTGDVAMLLPNGALKLIDRKKNIFKLSQGEYIAPDKIENIYLTNKYVGEIYVYGDPHRTYLIGIVVPERENLMKLGEEMGLKGKSFEELCKDREVVEKVMSEMNVTGKNGKLAGFELIKNLHLEPKSFVVLELTTPSMKLKRPSAKTFFKGLIEELYGNVKPSL